MSNVRKEFGFVNLVVEVYKKQVKIWACNKEGRNVFRLKSTGGEVRFTKELKDIVIRKEVS